MAQADDHIYALQIRAGGERRQTDDVYVLGVDIRQRAGLLIVEMMVRGRVGVIKYLGWIGDDLAHHALFRQKPERVVHGSFRYQLIAGIHFPVDVLRRHMLAALEQHTCDRDPLRSRMDAAPGKERAGIGLGERVTAFHLENYRETVS